MRAIEWILAAVLTGGGAAAAEAVQVGKPAGPEIRPASDGKPGRVEVPDRPEAKPAPPARASRPEPGRSEAKVNINAATKAQLMTRDGVGPRAAKRIIDHREAHGPFKKAFPPS